MNEEDFIFGTHIDKLEREKYANNITLLIKNDEAGFVISIDGSWGSGKTWFLKMWKNKLYRIENMVPIYYNAWENDDHEDALIPLLAELKKQYIDQFGEESNQEKWGHIGEAAFYLVKQGIYSLMKFASQGMVDAQVVEDKLTEAVDIVKKAPDKWFESEILAYQKAKEQRQKFMQLMEELRIAKQGDEEAEPRKVVFIIDELDRCRPPFAIETLERIKHLFSIPGFYFVLGIDRQQLSQSIKTIYGQKMDTTGYLRRFIDIEMSLPNPSITEYLDMKLKDNGFVYDDNFVYSVKKTIENTDAKWSLRDFNKLVLWMEILHNEKQTVVHRLLGLFIVWKLKRSDLCEVLYYENYDAEEYRETIIRCKQASSFLNTIDKNMSTHFFDFLLNCKRGKRWNTISFDNNELPYCYSFRKNNQNQNPRDMIRDSISFLDHINVPE